MSGKRWTPERKAAHAARMRERWRRSVYAKRAAPTIGEAARAARSARMKCLNDRMRDDKELKRKCVRGQKRVRRTQSYRAIQSAVMTATMARPELRALAAEHAARINKDPTVRRRQWAGRRRKKWLAQATAESAIAASLRRPALEHGDPLLARLQLHHGEPSRHPSSLSVCTEPSTV